MSKVVTVKEKVRASINFSAWLTYGVVILLLQRCKVNSRLGIVRSSWIWLSHIPRSKYSPCRIGDCTDFSFENKAAAKELFAPSNLAREAEKSNEGDDVPMLHLFNSDRSPTSTNTNALVPAEPKFFPQTLFDFAPLKLDPKRCLTLRKPTLPVLQENVRVHNSQYFWTFIYLHQFIGQSRQTQTGKLSGNEWREEGLRLTKYPWKKDFYWYVRLYETVSKSQDEESLEMWRRDPTKHAHKAHFASEISTNRRFLHIYDETGCNGKEVFFDKLKPFMLIVTQTSKHLWHLECALSVNKMMVMQPRRSSELVWMKKNPACSGYKVWSIWDSGYMFHAFPHSNRDTWERCLAHGDILPHLASIVVCAGDELFRAIVGAVSITMYSLPMENLFSTLKHFRLSWERNIGATWTVGSNAGGFPKLLAVRSRKGIKLDKTGLEHSWGGSLWGL